MRRGTRAVAVGLVAASMGCGSKGAVSVVALIQAPSASVMSSALERRLNGEFRLHLELGQYAPSGTDVSIQAMSLERASDKSPLVSLKLVAAPAPPFHLEPGGAVDSTLTISQGDPTPGESLSEQQFLAICQERSVEISGSLSEPVGGQPILVTSQLFDVMGCP